MIDLKDTFDDLGNYAVRAFRASLSKNDRVATGKTSKAIRSESNNNGFTVYAPERIRALQDGRKPTQGGGSGSGFFDQILEWCRARGIDEGAAFPIYRKINREGYEGTPGLLDDPIKEIEIVTKKTIAKQASNKILNSLKSIKQ